MNAQHDDDKRPDWLRAELAALPDPSPPEALLGRILASRVRRRRRRQWSAAVALLLGAALLWPLLPPVAPGDPPAVAVDAAPDDLRLRLLDRRLQAAYDGGASAEQIEALWLARARHLAAAEAQPDTEETRDASILSL